MFTKFYTRLKVIVLSADLEIRNVSQNPTTNQNSQISRFDQSNQQKIYEFQSLFDLRRQKRQKAEDKYAIHNLVHRPRKFDKTPHAQNKMP